MTPINQDLAPKTMIAYHVVSNIAYVTTNIDLDTKTYPLIEQKLIPNIFYSLFTPTYEKLTTIIIKGGHN